MTATSTNRGLSRGSAGSWFSILLLMQLAFLAACGRESRAPADRYVIRDLMPEIEIGPTPTLIDTKNDRLAKMEVRFSPIIGRRTEVIVQQWEGTTLLTSDIVGRVIEDGRQPIEGQPRIASSDALERTLQVELTAFDVENASRDSAEYNTMLRIEVYDAVNAKMVYSSDMPCLIQSRNSDAHDVFEQWLLSSDRRDVTRVVGDVTPVWSGSSSEAQGLDVTSKPTPHSADRTTTILVRVADE